MQNDEQDKTSRPSPGELTFKSIFEPRDPVPTDLELWSKPSKDFDPSKLGSPIFSSKLHKKSKQVGIYISRYYFLFPKYLGYSNSNNPSKIKKYAKLDGLKIRTTQGKGKAIHKYYLTFYRGNSSFVLVTKDQNILDEWRKHLGKACIMLDFSKFYLKKELLGRGAHGKVILAEKIEDKSKYAVKVFEKAKLQAQFRGLQNLINEIDILKSIDHKDVIKLYEVYESETDVYLVLEYVDGGDLQSRLRRKGFYSEKSAIAITRNILGVLVYLQEKNLVHRDLKPANIVLCSMESDTEIKVIDFGFAVDIEKSKDLALRCGTPGYVAPEVLNPSILAPITEKADVFSVGTIFYQLLTGSRLFRGFSNKQVLQANKRCAFDEARLTRIDISELTLDLLLKLLEKNPSQRISAKEAFEHAVFRQYIASSAEIRDDSQILNICQTTKYSFDMVQLKESNISSHSRIIDTFGTFYVVPHMSIDALESQPKSHSRLFQVKKTTSPLTSRKGSENSSKGNTRPISPDSWDESLGHLDEERKADGSFERVPRLRRPSTYGAMQSPIHKAAIMNNLKKLVQVKEETLGNTEEDSSSKDLPVALERSYSDLPRVNNRLFF